MNIEELIQLLKLSGQLKTTYRHCQFEERVESVADHSYRLALFAYLLSFEEEFQSLDMNKVIKMCLIHDLGEAFTGDIPTFVKSREDGEKEDDLLINYVKSLQNDALKKEWLALLEEMNERRTLEAKLYKALDKLEAIISHIESSIDTWLELEYELQYTYGKEEIAFSPYLIKLREYIDKWTTEKITNH